MTRPKRKAPEAPAHAAVQDCGLVFFCHKCGPKQAGTSDQKCAGCGGDAVVRRWIRTAGDGRVTDEYRSIEEERPR